MLQLADVAQRFHARAVAVDVAARGRPARHQRRELLEAGLGQVAARLAAGLEIDRLPRHVLRVALGGVAVAARLDRVDHRHPGIEVAAVEKSAHRRAHLVAAELAHHLRHGQIELAVKRLDLATVVGGDRVLARGQRVVMDHAVEVIDDDRGRRAVGAQLLIHRVQRAVGVRAREHVEHQALHVMQPDLDGLAGHHLGVGRGQAEPRSRRARHARHHAGGQHPQRARAGRVVDVVVALVALVAVGREEPPRARQQVVADLAPVREPARALGLERAPPGEELVAFGLAHVSRQAECSCRATARPGSRPAARSAWCCRRPRRACCWP